MAKPNYVSVDDLEIIMPKELQAEATDDTLTKDAEIDASKVKEHLKFAESKVESFLLEYDLPFSSPAPHAVRWAVLVVAAYMLMRRGDMSVTEDVEELYRNVIEWLQMVREGEAQIPGIDNVPDDYVGFGQKNKMKYQYFPYSDFKSSYFG